MADSCKCQGSPRVELFVAHSQVCCGVRTSCPKDQYESTYSRNMKEEISTGDTASAHLLSQAIRSNGFIFLSGQVHADAELKLVGDTTSEKVSAIMGRIQNILEHAGATLNDIVKVVIYVTDMSIMPELNEAYPEFFNAPLPVREAVCVAALPLGAQIEISVVAVEPE